MPRAVPSGFSKHDVSNASSSSSFSHVSRTLWAARVFQGVRHALNDAGRLLLLQCVAFGAPVKNNREALSHFVRKARRPGSWKGSISAAVPTPHVGAGGGGGTRNRVPSRLRWGRAPSGKGGGGRHTWDERTREGPANDWFRIFFTPIQRQRKCSVFSEASHISNEETQNDGAHF